jgi:DNA-binding MarR family transcriptional regulator
MSKDNSKPYWIYETTVQQNDRLILSKKMLRSKAFVSLTGAAKQILIELYTRLKLESYKPRKRHRNSERFFAVNNGELVLSYKSIHKQFGYSTATISKAIDRLVEHGFIEIAELGCGVKRQSHKIALINNWQEYETENFRPGQGKPKAGPVNKGFKKRKQADNLETTVETKVGTTSETKAVQVRKRPKAG